MNNYASEWKKKTNITLISYNDFITKFKNINAFYSEKIDGQLSALVYQKNKDIFFQTTQGNELRNLPVIDEYKKILDELNFNFVVLIGELTAIVNNKIVDFEKSQSIIKTAYRKPENRDVIKHFLFDVFIVDGKYPKYDDALRHYILRYFSNKSYIKIPEMIKGDTSKFEFLYNKVIKKNSIEGIIARDVDGKNYKIKESNTVDLVVIGAGNKNMKSWPKKQISYLITAFIDKDGNFIRSSSVTVTSIKDGSYFYEYINNNKIYEDEKGNVFCKPELVVEVKFAKVNDVKAPSYKLDKNQYVNIGLKNSYSLIHPAFLRLREDKNATYQDTRMEQIPK